MSDRRSDKPQFRTLREGGSVVVHGVRIDVVGVEGPQVKLKVWRERKIMDLEPSPIDISGESAIQ